MIRQVPAAYTVMLIREAEQAGLDLLADFNLTLQDVENKQLISEEFSREVMSRYTRSKVAPEWGFQFGQKLGIASHGPLGFGALSATTVRDGLLLLAKYIAVRTAHVLCRAESSPEKLVIIFQLAPGISDYSRRMCETLSMVFQSYLEAVGASAAPTFWHFPFEQPENGAHYGRFIHGGYGFGSPQFTFEVPGSVAMVVSPFQDPSAYRACINQCDVLLAAVRGSVPKKVHTILHSAFLARLAESVPVTDVPVIDEVAGHLEMSKRTLIRKLQAAGTRFQDIKDELLRELITELLAGSNPMRDIAERLGYCDAGNFSRACRRLLGDAPSRLREAASLRH